MKYVGSKNRISKHIVPIIQFYIDKMGDNCNGYWEPFVGGANMIDKIKAPHKYDTDAHEYLIALLCHVQQTIRDVPDTITKEEYEDVRNNLNNSNGYMPWYTDLVGFCASYNGKWFGGYANGIKTKIGTVRNYTDEAIRNLKKQAPNLKGIEFSCCNYLDRCADDMVIYCDPPYRDTTKYATGNFDYDRFYAWCREMAITNIVLVSEYWMPEQWFKCIWSGKVKCTFDKNSRSNRVEKLWICQDRGGLYDSRTT